MRLLNLFKELNINLSANFVNLFEESKSDF